MIIGIIGLGKIGMSVAIRLIKGGYQVIGFDLDTTTCLKAEQHGIQVTNHLHGITHAQLIWLFLPAGQTIDSVLDTLICTCKPGTIIVDGGNSFYKDSIRRTQLAQSHNLCFLDCGTSGGIHGQVQGFCLMLGGDHDAYKHIEPILKIIAAPGGYAYVGPSGAGHYVKMVHNGIEYGLLQAYAEGFQLLKEGAYKNTLDLANISNVWQHGSIIRSWILELTHTILVKDQDLSTISGEIGEFGTGRWTAQDAEQHAVPMPVLRNALEVRTTSRESGGNFATKLIALLRHSFGGHPYKEKK